MTERINILIGSDIHYAPYYGVMLTSLFMNNKESQFDVYLLTDNTWTETETKKFEKLANEYKSQFIVKEVDEDILRDFPQVGHITLPTYYRLQAANLLPDSVQKLLYLDGDMIVSGDIRPLWNTDLSGFAFAGANDCAFSNKEVYARLGYDEMFGYINAGVTLYNIAYWRENNLSAKLIEYIGKHKASIVWMDQDAINAMLYKNKKVLSWCYNFQVYFLYKEWWNTYNSDVKKEIMAAMNCPIIIHYNGLVKPWSYRYWNYPYYNLWMHYYKLSNWRVSMNKPLDKYVKSLIKRYLFQKKWFLSKKEKVADDFISLI